MVRILFLLVLSAFATSAHATPVQWPVNQGGNGHYYDWVPGYLSWTNAKNAAAASTFQGVNGNLATVTSQAENDFFASQFSQTSGQTLIGWLGGFQDTSAPDYSEPAGGWRWVTGEAWNYTSWWTAKNLPDDFGGHQDFIRTQPVGGSVFWDDIQNDPGAAGVAGYFVEFAVPEPTVGLVAFAGLLTLRARGNDKRTVGGRDGRHRNELRTRSSPQTHHPIPRAVQQSQQIAGDAGELAVHGR